MTCAPILGARAENRPHRAVRLDLGVRLATLGLTDAGTASAGLLPSCPAGSDVDDVRGVG